MKKFLILLLSVFVLSQAETFAKSGGGGSSRSGSSSSSRSVRSSSTPSRGTAYSRNPSVNGNNKNAAKIGNSGSKSVRTFQKPTASQPKSITKYVGKPFTAPKTITTSKNSLHAVSYTYTRPVRFSNPYLIYYYLPSHSSTYHSDSARVDTTAFPGFGKGKAGGAGASISFADSLQKHSSRDTLEISELQPINYLSDYAGIIPDKDEARINYLIRHYKKVTGVEMAVLTIPTLGDEIDLEDYAQVLFDKWGIGEAGVNNGILILISSEDEILRVQPGYGLEEFLPDMTCREIEDNIMVPLCQKDEWEPAVTGAISSIIKTMGDKPIEIMKAELAERKKKEHQEMIDNLYIFVKVVGALAIVVLILLLIFKKKRY